MRLKTATISGSSRRSAGREFQTDGLTSDNRESTFCKLSSCSQSNIFGA